MSFSIRQAALSAMHGASKAHQELNLAENWDLHSVGLGLLDESMKLTNSNESLQLLLQLNIEALQTQSFFSWLNIDPLLRTSIVKSLHENESWQGIIHNNDDEALRMQINRKQTDTAVIIYSVFVINYSEDYNKLKELYAAKMLAEKTDKAKSQFLSHMSHELRTPLNAILGFTQLMQVSEALSEIQQDNLHEIESAGNYLLSLINEVLDLSRIEAGKIHLSEDSVSINQVLHECIAMARPLSDKKQVTIDYELDSSRYIQTDHVRLKQVLLNLLSNAVKYNVAGGIVSCHCIDVNQGALRIEVRDTGSGIRSDLIENIFSPFERLGADDKKIEGTGIGLMITRRLVQLMGGKIGVNSEPERGSVFWFELPSMDTCLEKIFTINDSTSILIQPESEFGLYCIGMPADYETLIERTLELRKNIQLSCYGTLHDAIPSMLQHKPSCVLLSSEAADELRMDSRNLLSLKNLNLVVVETIGNKNQAREVDSSIFNTSLPEMHSLHEFLQVMDKFCTNV